MKKLLFISAIAALCMLSCNKDDSNKGNKNNNKDKDDDTEYVAPITIDGEFADWAKLDASKIAEAKCEEGASHEALKLVKVYADELYIYIYFEWDKDMVEHRADETVPFHIYLNADGDTATGGFSDQFTDACTEFLFEGMLFDADGNVTSYDPACAIWVGEVNGASWEWEDTETPAGICTGAGVEGKYELSICRELYPLGTIADTFSIGFDIQQAWDSVGVLPNSAEGTANSLQVVTN